MTVSGRFFIFLVTTTRASDVKSNATLCKSSKPCKCESHHYTVLVPVIRFSPHPAEVKCVEGSWVPEVCTTDFGHFVAYGPNGPNEYSRRTIEMRKHCNEITRYSSPRINSRSATFAYFIRNGCSADLRSQNCSCTLCSPLLPFLSIFHAAPTFNRMCLHLGFVL